MGGEVFLRPAWADAPKEYNTGGKVKKSSKPKKAKSKSEKMSQKVSQNVKVNVKIGDSVMLRKGNAPARKERVPVAKKNPGEARRFMSQGNAFGGGLPRPLISASYMSAPPVATPQSRMDFIGSSDAQYNRNRVHFDDVVIQVNPSDIKVDVSPSIRAFENTKAVESPDSGLALSRIPKQAHGEMSEKESPDSGLAISRIPKQAHGKMGEKESPDSGLALSRILKQAHSEMGEIMDRNADIIARNMAFLGKSPVNQVADMTPSSRAVASQPSTGFLNTKGSLIGTAPTPSLLATSASAWEEISRYKQESSAPAPAESVAGLSSVSQPGLTSPSKRRPASETQRYKKEDLYGPAKSKREAPPVTYTERALRSLIKEQYPTLKELKAGGYDSYADALQFYKDNGMADGLPGFNRGGRVHSAF